MNDAQRRLREQYSSRADYELIALYNSNELTEIAQETLQEVLLERGIDISRVEDETYTQDFGVQGTLEQEEINDAEEYKGIEGWLIVVAIGLWIGLAVEVIFVFKDFVPVFTEGYWTLLTDPNSPSYITSCKAFVLYEMIGVAVIIALRIAVLHAFHKQLSRFPPMFIGLILIGIFYSIIDTALASQILDDAGSTGSPFSLSAFIWIPYMLMSKRVKQTFVN